MDIEIIIRGHGVSFEQIEAIIKGLDNPAVKISTEKKPERILKDPDTGEHHTLGEKPSTETETGQLKFADPKCGKLFTPPTKKSIYCSNKCYQRSYWHLHSKLQHRDQFTQPEKPANTPAKEDIFHKKLEILKEKGIPPIPEPKIKRDFQS